jgi:cytochrome c oxidase cbb3-type subunit IV
VTYESVAYFVKTYWWLQFMVLFAGVLLYALWPGNKEMFDKAARIPLEDDNYGEK